MSESEFTAVLFVMLAAILLCAFAAVFYELGKRAGVVAEWNRINDAKLEKDRLRRLRDGRTREFKRAVKISKPNDRGQTCGPAATDHPI